MWRLQSHLKTRAKKEENMRVCIVYAKQELRRHGTLVSFYVHPRENDVVWTRIQKRERKKETMWLNEIFAWAKKRKKKGESRNENETRIDLFGCERRRLTYLAHTKADESRVEEENHHYHAKTSSDCISHILLSREPPGMTLGPRYNSVAGRSESVRRRKKRDRQNVKGHAVPFSELWDAPSASKRGIFFGGGIMSGGAGIGTMISLLTMQRRRRRRRRKFLGVAAAKKKWSRNGGKKVKIVGRKGKKITPSKSWGAFPILCRDPNIYLKPPG